MEISLKVMQKLQRLLNSTQESFFKSKKTFYPLLNKFVTYFQKKYNKIFSNDDIRSLLIFYKFLSLLEGLDLPKLQENYSEYSDLSINYIIEDYLLQKDIRINLTETETKSLNLKVILENNLFFNNEVNEIVCDNEQKEPKTFLDKNLLLVYDLNGAIDHLYLIYLSNLINEKNKEKSCHPLYFKEYNQRLKEFSNNFFGEKVNKFLKQDYDYNLNFLNYINDDENDFFEYVMNNFYFILLGKFEKTKRKIVKLLFLGLNCLKENKLIACLELLNKIFSENFYFISKQEKENFSFMNINKFKKDNLLKNSHNHLLLLFNRKEINSKSLRFFSEIYPLTSENLDKIETLNSPIIEIYILNSNLDVINHHKLLKPAKLDRSFFYLREKDFFNENFESFSQFKGKSSIILNLLSNNHIEINQLKNKTLMLSEKNVNLFTNLNFDKLKLCKDNFQITKYVQKSSNPLENFQLLKLVSRNLVRFAKKYSLSGFFIRKFTDCFQFTNLPPQKYYSLEDLQRQIFDINKSSHKTSFYLIDKSIQKYQNPFLVYLTHKFFTKIKSFQIITSNHPELMCLGNVYFISDFSKNRVESTSNYLNFLNSQFFNKICHYPINLNLLLEVKVHENPDKNNLLKIFFKFLKNLFNVSFIFHNRLIEKDTFVYSNALIDQSQETHTEFTTYYFPIIFEYNEENDFLGCFTYMENSICIFIKKISDNLHKNKVQVSLRALYDFFIHKNLKFSKFVNFKNNNKTKLFDFYEILNNKLEITIDKFYKGEITFVTEDHESKIKQKAIDIDYDYFQVHQFFEKFRENKVFTKTVDLEFLLEQFYKLLDYFKIDNIVDFQKILKLPQIKNFKDNYQLILLLMQKMIQNKKLENYTSLKKKQLVDIFHSKKLKKIAILTPEYSKFMKVGGLAVMIEDLVEELKNFNEHMIILIPYYNVDLKNDTNYLKNKGLTHIYNISINLHNVDYIIGVSYLKERNACFYFLHNYYLFPKIYTYYDKEHQMKQISVFNLAALKVLQRENEKPVIVLTNDWFAGLAACYAKSHFFNDYFEKSKFLHIIHNIGDDYQGRIYLEKSESEKMNFISGLGSIFFIDPFWTDIIINPVRCALLCSDQWATVSKSYRKEILEHCSLKFLLEKFKMPFAFPNGVRSSVIQERLKKIESHKVEKMNLIRQFFGYDFQEESQYEEFILLGFVGRITEQKGVLLILDVFEEILHKYNNRILLILGGMIDNSEYSLICAEKINHLKYKYPKNFWGDPDCFFKLGTNLNKGADFFLMPSKYEPGGIVQHESLIAGTPVICFKTGGLQDTIFEYLPYSEGNGFNFIMYNNADFVYAIERAINCFFDKKSYSKLRKNCKNSFIEVSTVARAWRGEFYRLNNLVK